MQQRKTQQGDKATEAIEQRIGAERLRFSSLTLSIADDSASVETEWLALESLARNSLHQGFDWCAAWAKAHGRNLTVVKGMAGDRTVLLLPLDIVSEKGIRIACFPGDRFNNINTGLFVAELDPPDNEEEQNFVVTLRRLLADKADMVVLDNVPLHWRGLTHPLANLATIENQNHSFQLPLFPSFEATLAQLNTKTRRKKFRSSCRKLDAIGGYDHIVATAGSEKHSLLDLFFRQKSERLRMMGLPDVFSPPEIRDFFHRLLDVPMAGQDTPLVLHAIRLRGEYSDHISAIAGLSRKGDHVICQFGSIDETVCPEASPGELLFWLVIEQACREGASIFDFGVGDQLYKRNWCRQETVQHDILIPITWKGSLARPLLVGVTKAKAAIKSSPGLYASVQHWRSSQRSKLPATSGSGTD